jgi:dTDP-4-amino-4,6-dideoxygalactose transaminase
MSKIPVLDLRPEIDALRSELMAAIEGVLDSTAFIMGPNVKAFEQEVASYLGVRHAVALNSGTDALILGVHALGLRPGDEVITTAFTFFATGEAVSHFRATPVFVDIDPSTFNVDVAQIESKVTPRTKAIIPVHLFGQPCDMDAIMAVAERHGLKVLEDVAQAFGGDYRGRKLGSIGHAGAFSFFPSKNLGAFGDGGMLVTNDDAVADHARMLRVHGARKKYHNETVGVNSRLDELQAAILRVKFKWIDEANAGRRRVAHRYNERLFAADGITPPVEVDYGTHVFHQYTVRIRNDRDGVQKRLEEAGVGTMIYYPVPLHRLPVYKDLDYPAGALPHTERAADEVLSLPIWPQMDDATQDRVIEALSRAVAEGAPVEA